MIQSTYCILQCTNGEYVKVLMLKEPYVISNSKFITVANGLNHPKNMKLLVIHIQKKCTYTNFWILFFTTMFEKFAHKRFLGLEVA